MVKWGVGNIPQGVHTDTGSGEDRLDAGSVPHTPVPDPNSVLFEVVVVGR